MGIEPGLGVNIGGPLKLKVVVRVVVGVGSVPD